MKHIKWDHDISGYLSEKEKLSCEEIDRLLENLHNKGESVSVVITIEGGNQFHIKNKGECLLGYMTAEQCKYALKGICVCAEYIREGDC